MVGLLPIVEPVIGDVIVGFRGGVESTVTMTAVEAGLLLWAAFQLWLSGYADHQLRPL